MIYRCPFCDFAGGANLVRAHQQLHKPKHIVSEDEVIQND